MGSVVIVYVYDQSVDVMGGTLSEIRVVTISKERLLHQSHSTF